MVRNITLLISGDVAPMVRFLASEKVVMVYIRDTSRFRKVGAATKRTIVRKDRSQDDLDPERMKNPLILKAMLFTVVYVDIELGLNSPPLKSSALQRV